MLILRALPEVVKTRTSTGVCRAPDKLTVKLMPRRRGENSRDAPEEAAQLWMSGVTTRLRRLQSVVLAEDRVQVSMMKRVPNRAARLWTALLLAQVAPREQGRDRCCLPRETDPEPRPQATHGHWSLHRGHRRQGPQEGRREAAHNRWPLQQRPPTRPGIHNTRNAHK